jgi:hypothetical protein
MRRCRVETLIKRFKRKSSSPFRLSPSASRHAAVLMLLMLVPFSRAERGADAYSHKRVKNSSREGGHDRLDWTGEELVKGKSLARVTP